MLIAGLFFFLNMVVRLRLNGGSWCIFLTIITTRDEEKNFCMEHCIYIFFLYFYLDSCTIQFRVTYKNLIEAISPTYKVGRSAYSSLRAGIVPDTEN